MATKEVRLTNADDVFFGSDEAELIYGLDGSDRIFAGGGDDWIFSNDEASFGKWVDGLTTDPRSFIDGGSGNDRIDSYALHASIAIGGDGNDNVFSRSNETAYGFGGDGDDVLGVSGDQGDAYAYGSQGQDIITVWSHNGAAYASGGLGDDVISIDRSLSGKLVGGPGDDLLIVTYSEAGTEVRLIGGPGKDVLQGGEAGIERYVFRDGDTGVGARADQVLFFGEEDVIDLSQIDADRSTPEHDRFRFIGQAEDPGTGEVAYFDTTNGDEAVRMVTFDNGSGNQEFLLRFSSDTDLAANDFML
jgi:Ca2+-binding RTX toxin-like protein